MTVAVLPARIPPGHWVAASKLEHRLVIGGPGELYPCRCADLDPDPPAFVADQYPPGQVPRCRPWVSKKGKDFGLTLSRCPCWGRLRDERLPDTCCARHEHNPWYLGAAEVAALKHAAIVAEYARSASPATVFEDVELPDDDTPGAPVREPYRRRWLADQLTCLCPTPWDHVVDKNGRPLERGAGYHCVGCHTNWVNYATATAHRRALAGPCLPPADIRDCETGRRLLYAQDVGGFEVWAYR